MRISDWSSDVCSSDLRSRVAGPALTLVGGGFALPGIVIALSMVFLSLNTPVLDAFYQTFPLLVLAYVVHFGAQSVRAAGVAVGSVPARLDDAARMLGAEARTSALAGKRGLGRV